MIDEAAIGRRIKELRRTRGFTLQQIADATGLTKGYLSKVETSDRAAPVNTLAKIAIALDVPVPELFADVQKDERISVVRRGKRKSLPEGVREIGYSYELLCMGMAAKYMEPFLLTIPRHTVCEPVQHAGEELLFVLEGVMTFHYGDSIFTLEEGDSVYFDSGVPHFGEAGGDQDVRCVMVAYSSDRNSVNRAIPLSAGLHEVSS